MNTQDIEFAVSQMEARGDPPERIRAFLIEARDEIRKKKLAAEMCQSGGAEMCHPEAPFDYERALRQEAADVFGVSPQQVDIGAGPGFGKRMRLGLLDTPESVQDVMGPGSEVLEVGGQRVVAYQKPDGTVAFANPPGLDVGDIGDFLSREGPAIGGGMAGLGYGGVVGGPIGGIAGAFTGAAAGEALRRGALRETAGGERLSTQDIGPIIGQGALEALGAGIGKAVTAPASAVLGRGSLPMGRMREDLMNVQAVRGIDPSIPVPLWSRQFYSPVAKTTESQARSLTGMLNLKGEETQRAMVASLRGSIDQELVGARQELNRIAREHVRGMRDVQTRTTRGYTTEQGGQAAFDSIKRWGEKSRGDVKSAYAIVDDLADKERPQFDFAPMKQKTYAIDALGAPEEAPGAVVDLAGRPLTTEIVQEYVNVAKDPAGRVRRVLELVNRIDDTQTDYRVAKELRTQVGEALDDARFPWEDDRAAGIARDVYRDLTTVLDNPTNDAAGFVAAHRQASAMARDRFRELGNPELQKILKVADYTPARIGNALVSDPTMLNKGVIDKLFKDYNATDIDIVRRSILSTITDQQSSGGAEEAFRSWWIANKQQARRLFAGYHNYATHYLRGVDALNTSEIAKIANTIGDRVDVLKQLVSGLDEVSAKQLLSDLGGPGSRGHELARIAVHEQIYGRGVTYAEGGAEVSAAKLQAAVDEFKKSGVWDVLLTKEDRVRWQGLTSAARLSGSEKDVGTSLMRASAVEKLRHPATFMSGIHTIAGARLAGFTLVSDKANNLVMLWRLGKKGARPIEAKALQQAGVVLGGVADYLQNK